MHPDPCPAPSWPPLAEAGLRALRYVPGWLQRRSLALGLEQVLGPQCRRGELDFLLHRWIAVQVRDLGWDWRIGLGERGFRVEGPWQKAEATVRAGARDFLGLVAQRQDPDTLFFQRRLELEGDTELNLAVKNVLDSIDMSTLPAVMRLGLDRAVDWLAV